MKNSHSSQVVLTLIVCGFELTLSHVGPDYLVVRKSLDEIEGSKGQLVINVDGVIQKSTVVLPCGVSTGEFQKVLYFDSFSAAR